MVTVAGFASSALTAVVSSERRFGYAALHAGCRSQAANRCSYPSAAQVQKPTWVFCCGGTTESRTTERTPCGWSRRTVRARYVP